MSREIKFRLHCAETGKILAYEKFNTTLNWGCYWYDATLPEDDQICQTLDYFKHPHPLGKVVRVEFTGLKDVNGVEIYEGDILEFGEVYGEAGSVYFDDYSSSFVCRLIESGRVVDVADHLMFSNRKTTRKVIGNIHQHPELLK